MTALLNLEVGKLWLSFLLAVISKKMFASYVFRDKNQKPLRMSRMQITKQAVAILSLISGNGFVLYTVYFTYTGFIKKDAIQLLCFITQQYFQFPIWFFK